MPFIQELTGTTAREPTTRVTELRATHKRLKMEWRIKYAHLVRHFASRFGLWTMFGMMEWLPFRKARLFDATGFRSEF